MTFLKRIPNILLLAVMFFILAAIMTRMPVTRLGQNYTGEQDSLLVSWVWSWEMHTLPNNITGIFDANIFAPNKHTLAFTEHMFGSLLMAWPIFLLTKNIIATFNVVVLLSFVISGIGGYYLGWHFSKNKFIALACGLIYAFVPYKIHHALHINLSGMWLPFGILYLEKFLQKDSWKNILLFSFFVYLIFLNSMQFVIFFPGLVIIIVLGKTALGKFRFNKNNILKLMVALVGLAMCALPIIWPYLKFRTDYNFSRDIKTIEGLSPDIIDYFISPFVYKYFYVSGNNEWEVSPGWFFWILFGWVLLSIRKDREKLRQVFPYLFIGLAVFLLSFGYYIQFTRADEGGLIGPMGVLFEIWPLFRSVRAVGRLSIFFILAGIIIMAIGWEKIWLNKKKRIIIIVLLVLMMGEFSLVNTNFKTPINTRAVDEVYKWMKDQPDNDVYLEMPFGLDYLEYNWGAWYAFSSRHHWKKIANGYSGYATEAFVELDKKLKHFEITDLDLMKAYGVTRVVFHFNRFPKNFREKTNQALLDSGLTELLYSDQMSAVYYLK